jgi:phytoene synthase
MNADIAAYSQETMRQGSKSFAKAAMLFDADTRDSVMMLYAWCRHCDDVIDGQVLGHAQRALAIDEKLELLLQLQRETARVCDGHDSDIPAFAALSRVLQRHRIPRRCLFELLHGFELDATEADFATLDDTLRYCYHVAGVVGVMMAAIMGVDEEDTLHRASDLGIAFQLTNIARDLIDDLEIGRCYLPREWLARAGLDRARLQQPEHRAQLHALACELLALAERYYDSARIGMARLPWRCAWAIASALLIYRDIGLKLRAHGANAWEERIQVSNRRKLWRLCHGGWLAAGAKLAAARPEAPPRAGLWTRPL